MQNVPDFFQFQKDQESHIMQPQYSLEKQFLPTHPSMVYTDFTQPRMEPKIEEEKYTGVVRRSTRERKTPEKFRTSLLLDDEEDIGITIGFFLLLFFFILLCINYLRKNCES
jgi:hypothetical protein